MAPHTSCPCSCTATLGLLGTKYAKEYEISSLAHHDLARPFATLQTEVTTASAQGIARSVDFIMFQPGAHVINPPMRMETAVAGVESEEGLLVALGDPRGRHTGRESHSSDGRLQEASTLGLNTRNGGLAPRGLGIKGEACPTSAWRNWCQRVRPPAIKSGCTPRICAQFDAICFPERVHAARAADEARPRLRWTPELHDMFVVAVKQLGGLDRATPKARIRHLARALPRRPFFYSIAAVIPFCAGYYSVRRGRRAWSI